MAQETQAEPSEASNLKHNTYGDTKYCNGCNLTKSKSEFGKNSSSKDGLRHRCKECRAIEHQKHRDKRLISQKIYREANRDSIREAKKRCVNAKREEYLTKKRNYYEDNREEILAQMQEYRDANKEVVRQRHRDYYKNNSHVVKAHTAARRSLMRNCTPSWLSNPHFDKIKVFYKIASALERVHGVRYHVDHIVPLRGKLVCGLHVPWNLQVITAEENMSKGNKFNG